jgi:DNA-binding NarL/FixJ family response regulator
VARLRDVLHAIEHGLDDVGQAIVVTDDRERIAFASHAGRDALQLLDGARRDGSRLPDALQAVSADHTVMPVHDDAPLIVRRLPSERGTTVFLFERTARPTPLDQIEALGLSTREAEVLRRFMRGETTAAAAAALAVSPRTIHRHAEHVYRKLGVTDRVAAVSTAWAALDAGR